MNKFETLYATLDAIRKDAGALPTGKARQINNRCDRIAAELKKIERRPGAQVVVRNVQEERDQISARENAIKAVFQALAAGRTLSIFDSKEFRLSQMHTAICKIRRKIEDRALPWTLCDRWISYGPRHIRCKEYWLEPIEHNNKANN